MRSKYSEPESPSFSRVSSVGSSSLGSKMGGEGGRGRRFRAAHFADSLGLLCNARKRAALSMSMPSSSPSSESESDDILYSEADLPCVSFC